MSGRKKNLVDVGQAEREYEDALSKAKRYLDATQRSLEGRDTHTAVGYLTASAEMLGLALGHLQYLEHVGRSELGRYRGLRDRMEGLQSNLRARVFDPASELRFNPRGSPPPGTANRTKNRLMRRRSPK